MRREGVPNLFRVSDILYRSAQPSSEGMRTLKAMGIATIVNLRSFHTDRDRIKGTGLMKRAIPLWRGKVAEHGEEKGSSECARAKCERYHCSLCGKALFRGAQRCRACKRSVADELDGSLGRKGNENRLKDRFPHARKAG